MANKITITVNEARRTATLSWRGSGNSGPLVLSQEFGELDLQPLPPTTSNKAYWNYVLTTVAAALT